MDFSALSVLLFLVITAFLYMATVLGISPILKRMRLPNYYSSIYLVALGMGSWLLLLAFLATRGVFSNIDTFPPRIIMALFVPLIIIVFLAINKGVKEFLSEAPAGWLIYLQSYRIIVEIVLWLLYKEGNGPEIMTLEGRNFDMITGLTAPVIAFICFGKGRSNKNLALIWNFMGIALLLNVIISAILSMPAIGVFDEPVRFVTYFPFVWLPGFVAPYALMLHVLSIRQLLNMK